MAGRIVRSADFERVLGVAIRARSEHFAVHHVPGSPSRSTGPVKKRSSLELSTDASREASTVVDDSMPDTVAESSLPEHLWLGLVVPKRHARRSVTRNLFKRQMRAAVISHESELPAGLWVLRLRAPFDKSKFISAASDALKQAARQELESLICSAARLIRSR